MIWPNEVEVEGGSHGHQGPWSALRRVEKRVKVSSAFSSSAQVKILSHPAERDLGALIHRLDDMLVRIDRAEDEAQLLRLAETLQLALIDILEVEAQLSELAAGQSAWAVQKHLAYATGWRDWAALAYDFAISRSDWDEQGAKESLSGAIHAASECVIHLLKLQDGLAAAAGAGVGETYSP